MAATKSVTTHRDLASELIFLTGRTANCTVVTTLNSNASAIRLIRQQEKRSGRGRTASWYQRHRLLRSSGETTT